MKMNRNWLGQVRLSKKFVSFHPNFSAVSPNDSGVIEHEGYVQQYLIHAPPFSLTELMTQPLEELEESIKYCCYPYPGHGFNFCQ